MIAGLLTLVSAGCCSVSPGSRFEAISDVPGSIAFETAESTLLDLDVSPDGDEIVFTILGDLYVVPVGGGHAESVRATNGWKLGPRFSPDGGKIAYTVDENSRSNGVWVLDRLEDRLTQIGDRNSELLAWSHDNRKVLVSDGAGVLSWRSVLDAGHSSDLTHTSDLNVHSVVVSPDGSSLYVAGSLRQGGSADIYRIDSVTGRRELILAGATDVLSELRLTGDGTRLAYLARPDSYYAETLSIRLLNLGDGMKRNVASTAYVGRTFSYGLAGDGSAVYFPAEGRIASVDIGTGKTSSIPFKAHIQKQLRESVLPKGSTAIEKIRHLRWITASTDRRNIVFSAVGKIWVYDTATAVARRLTDADHREYAPSISPDGRHVAYVTWSDQDYGSVRVLCLKSGQERMGSSATGFYTNPTWSPDGDSLAYLAARPGHEQDHFRPSDLTGMDLIVQSLSDGRARVVADISAPYHSMTRFYTPLQFVENGDRILFSEPVKYSFPLRRALVSVSKDGQDKKVHLVHDNRIDHIVSSPDSMNLAVIRRTGLSLAELDKPITELERASLAGDDIRQRQLSESGASYAHWQEEGALLWSFNNRVYSWQEEGGGAIQSFEIDIKDANGLQPGYLALTNARLITLGPEQVMESGSILIRGNSIQEVVDSKGWSPPPGAVTVDLTGKTVMPGLIDTHTHVHQLPFGGVEIFPQVKREYLSSLAYGVTTLFDPAAPTLSVFAQAEMVAAGAMLGPRVYSTGAVLQPYAGGMNYVDTRDPASVERIVSGLEESGALMIKSYGQERENDRETVLQAGIRNDIPIIGHGDRQAVGDLLLALEGFPVIEHMPRVSPMRNDVLSLFALARTHITPTINVSLTAVQGSPYHRFFCSMYRDRKFRRFAAMNSSMYRGEAKDFCQNVHAEFRDLRLEHGLNDIKNLVRSDVDVSIGSHASNGIGAHWEMNWYARAGLSALEVLQSATIVGARKLGLEESLGSIEAGKLADLVILNSDPLEDINNTQDIEYVVANGRLFHSVSMTQLFPDYKVLKKPVWFSDERWEELRPEAPGPLRVD